MSAGMVLLVGLAGLAGTGIGAVSAFAARDISVRVGGIVLFALGAALLHVAVQADKLL